MKNELPKRRTNAELKEENEFLKIKMMLEHGAEFNESNYSKNIDPQLENYFLNSIMEFEKQFKQRRRITVFEKLNKPAHFVRSKDLQPSEIEEAWEQLHQYLIEHQIELDVCSPNVNSAELYRFVTEELFLEEMDDINIKGMVCNFIYDDFHPDHEYDNTRTATDDCISCILSKRDFEWMHHFAENNLQLNNNFQLSKEEFKTLILTFQSRFNSIDIIAIENISCELNDKCCMVNGTYKMAVDYGGDTVTFEDSWIVQFEFNKKTDFWEIINVQLTGLRF